MRLMVLLFSTDYQRPMSGAVCWQEAVPFELLSLMFTMMLLFSMDRCCDLETYVQCAAWGQLCCPGTSASCCLQARSNTD